MVDILIMLVILVRERFAMPPATRLRRSERQALIRDELVDAAATVFAQKGYEAASVAEIAAEAGYTVGAVYSNFAGKRALFEAVFAQKADEQFALATSLMHSVDDLEGIARRLLDQNANQRRWWLLWLEAVIEAQRDPAKAFSLGELEARSRSSIADILRGQLPGIDEDLTLATALQAIWRGWILGEATDQQSDAEGLARAMEWLIVGAAAGSKVQASPSRNSLQRS
jgi:AcrR family transcriptional regulator